MIGNSDPHVLPEMIPLVQAQEFPAKCDNFFLKGQLEPESNVSQQPGPLWQRCEVRAALELGSVSVSRRPGWSVAEVASRGQKREEVMGTHGCEYVCMGV